MWHGIYGQDAVVERFRHSLAQGRLASSFLFLGPAGVGKRTFAMKLAQALLCQQSEAAALEPCGQCESCRLLVAGSHPDLDLVGLPAGKRRLPVDLFLGDRDHRNQVGLCHNVSLRPRLGQRRVAIIDDADYLTIESANCLLKTLEEPPPGAILILIGTSRGRQLPTILSRTQTVRFSPLDKEVLRRLLLEQQIAGSPEQAEQLAQVCGGSLSRAAQLADEELWELQQRLLPQLVPTRLDSVRLAAELIAFVNQAGKEADARRQRLRAVLQMVGDHFRRLLRHCSGAVALSADVPADVAAEWIPLGVAAQDAVLAVLDRCLEAEVQLDRNANQATLLECWLDDLASIFATCQLTMPA